MKPLTLVMRAFGPYAGEQRVDFSALARQPLFLVHGPTGAGKSSILDAICYALFGEVSGSSREKAAQLRSLWAAPEVATEVTLDFMLGDACYRIRRRPAQERAKKRGQGTTPEGPKAWLWRRPPDAPEEEDGTLLESGDRKVDARISALLGLTAAQFRQVIVLPQGEFRRLLDASTRDRQAILQKLFDTELFARIEQVLKARAEGLKQQLQAFETRRAALLSPHAVEDEDALRENLQKVDSEIEKSSATIKKYEKKEESSRQALEQARLLARRLREHAEAQRRLAALRAQAPRFADMEQRLARAEQAAALEPLHATLRERRTAEAESAAALQRAEAAAQKATETLQRAEKALNEARRAAEELPNLTQQITRLETLLPDIQALAERETEAAALEKECAGLEKQLAQQAAALQQAGGREQQARERLQALQAALREAHAVALAHTLRDGSPCPVCGATEHPAPAHARAGEDASASAAPSPEALKKAEQALRKAEEQVRQAQAAHDEQQRTLLRQQDRLEVLREELARLRGRLPEAWRDADAARRQLEEMKARQQALQAALTQAEKAYEEARQAAQQAQAQQQAARQAHEQALRQREKQEQKFAERLLAEGMEDEAAWLSMRLGEEERQEMRQSLASHREALAAAEALAARAAKEAEGLQEPDMAALEAAWKEADAALGTAREAHGRLLERQRALRATLEQLQALRKEEEALRAARQDVHALSALASGENPARITLERYVLAALLDEVLLAASERLRVMSDGRYLLQRRAQARRGGGLELDVFDGWTGEARPVQTLSGGESFLAALSLALGLADVVQARSGVVRMDALFIDEGFGALDAEALERALDALLRLKAEGRLIGIISHVAELRERIPAQLEVKAARGGSHVHLKC